MHISQIMPAESEPPHFAASEQVVPRYIRGKRAIVEQVIEPTAVENEEEGFGAMPDRGATTIVLPFR